MHNPTFNIKEVLGCTKRYRLENPYFHRKGFLQLAEFILSDESVFRYQKLSPAVRRFF